jgi:hypothetical protein
MRNTLTLVGLGSLLVAAAAGCPTRVDDICSYPEACLDQKDSGASGASGSSGTPSLDGSADGDGTLVVRPDVTTECDLTKSPSASPGCIDEAYGVFVDVASGKDDNRGSKGSPYKTIAKALSSNGTKRVYVCEGSYPEGIKLTAGASVYGGFTCGSWVAG